MTHSEWLNNEYEQWIAALNECTVHNFKEHPMVRRMLSEVDCELWRKEIQHQPLPIKNFTNVNIISEIGGRFDTGRICRMVYYAQQVLKLNPRFIYEIGGGVGQFYAIIRALGYKGGYWIDDLPEVRAFQRKFLREVTAKTGLNTYVKAPYIFGPPDTVVSFYALGEFDDDTKKDYKTVIESVPHGYIAWNPHSGASDDLSIFPDNITVTPGIEPGIKIIQW